MKIKTVEVVNENGIVKTVERGVTLVVHEVLPVHINTYQEKTYKKHGLILRDTPDHEYIQYYEVEVAETRSHILNGVCEGDTVEVILQLAGNAPKINKEGISSVYKILRVLDLKIINKAAGYATQQAAEYYGAAAYPQQATAVNNPALNPPAPKAAEEAEELPF